MQALIKEIQIKSRYASVTSLPITAIFFGGGMPTTLTAGQIRRIGQAIHDHSDLSALEEFTFEMEVKSITEEKCEAMRAIGLNKARFGLQTFDPQYRELFNITATLDQKYAAAEMLRRHFEYTSSDIIYGLHGQTVESFTRDVQQALDMGTDTIEFYPITNLVTQASLHHGYVRAGLETAELHAEDVADHVPGRVCPDGGVAAAQRARPPPGCRTAKSRRRSRSSRGGTPTSTTSSSGPTTTSTSWVSATPLSRRAASTPS